MATPTTPDEWLIYLTKRLDARAERVARLRSYCDGNAPLPEMGRNLRTSWIAFQRKARVNYGGLAVRALKNRIRPLGVRAGDGKNKDLVAQCERIWRDNRMATQINMAIRDRLEVYVGYLVVGLDQARRAVVTREKPELFIAEPDPLQPWKARAALKVWRDNAAGQDFALVWVAGQRQKYMRDPKDASGQMLKRAAPFQDSGQWEKAGEPETFEGPPPVIVLERPEGRGLIEEHLDVIDGINLGKLQRLVITAMQAFRQRGIKGNLPDKDDDGNDIDWAQVFSPAPGALWDLPEGIDVWESEQTDIRPLLEGEKADRRDFAAVTSTPLSVFLPEGANQSAEGAANAKEGHVALAEDEIDDIRPAVAMAMVYALRAEDTDLGDATIEVDFAPPALVSLTEKWAAAAQAKAAGMPLRTIMRAILGWSPEQIREAEADMTAEQLAALFSLDESDPAGGGSGVAS